MSAGSREHVWQRTVHLAAQVIPGAHHASVTLLGTAGPTTPAATGLLAEEVDRIQYEVGEGPCLDAAHTGEIVLTSDLDSETRWPDFRTRMADRTEVSSMFSVPLRDVAAPGGALNVSSPARAAFPAPSRAMALAVAAIAGATLAGATERERAAVRVAHLEGFAAVLGHELRSGMTVTLAAADVLGRRRARLDQPGQRALDVLVEELRSQARMLRELLELGPGRSPRIQPVSLLPALEHVVRLHPRQDTQVHDIQFHPAAAGATVAVHPARLAGMLTTLLDNGDRRGGVTRVEVGIAEPEVWVAVDDAGPSVPTDRREGPFAGLRAPPGPAGDTDTNHPPFPWIREYARAAGGDLTVEDLRGGGTRFRLSLPLADADPASP